MPQNPMGFLAPLYINYVFPCIYDNNEDFSSFFKDNFLLTEPFNIGKYAQFGACNLNTLKTTASNRRRLENKYIHVNRGKGAILATPLIYSEYENTLLYDVEELLFYFPTEKVFY